MFGWESLVMPSEPCVEGSLTKRYIINDATEIHRVIRDGCEQQIGQPRGIYKCIETNNLRRVSLEEKMSRSKLNKSSESLMINLP